MKDGQEEVQLTQGPLEMCLQVEVSFVGLGMLGMVVGRASRNQEARFRR